MELLKRESIIQQYGNKLNTILAHEENLNLISDTKICISIYDRIMVRKDIESIDLRNKNMLIFIRSSIFQKGNYIEYNPEICKYSNNLYLLYNLKEISINYVHIDCINSLLNCLNPLDKIKIYFNNAESYPFSFCDVLFEIKNIEIYNSNNLSSISDIDDFLKSMNNSILKYKLTHCVSIIFINCTNIPTIINEYEHINIEII